MVTWRSRLMAGLPSSSLSVLGSPSVSRKKANREEEKPKAWRSSCLMVDSRLRMSLSWSIIIIITIFKIITHPIPDGSRADVGVPRHRPVQPVLLLAVRAIRHGLRLAA